MTKFMKHKLISLKIVYILSLMIITDGDIPIISPMNFRCDISVIAWNNWNNSSRNN